MTSLLVRSISRWPGVVTRPGDIGRKVFTATRPPFFFDPAGNSPEVVTFQTTLPRAIDAPDEQLETRLRQRVNQVQEETTANAEAQGLPFVGEKKIVATSPHDAPRTRSHGFGLSPHVACKDVTLRVRLLELLKRFRGEYRAAWKAFRDGDRDVVFPAGTLLMVERFGCAHRDRSELALFDLCYT